MKIIQRYSILIFIAALLSCDDENAFDCVKTVGNISTYNLDVLDVSSIEVFGDIKITIENSEEEIILLTTGENLYPKISYDIIDGKLTVSDNNKCSWVRNYGNSTLTIKSNKITSIRNSGSRDVRSIGTYNFTGSLNLTSQNTSGDYHMSVSGDHLKISSNKVSNFYIQGELTNLTVGFYSGQGRFEGENLIVNSVNIFHRGSNDIIVRPSQLLNGSIESYGNIIVYGDPKTIDTDIQYNGTGQLIYK